MTDSQPELVPFLPEDGDQPNTDIKLEESVAFGSSLHAGSQPQRPWLRWPPAVPMAIFVHLLLILVYTASFALVVKSRKSCVVHPNYCKISSMFQRSQALQLGGHAC